MRTRDIQIKKAEVIMYDQNAVTWDNLEWDYTRIEKFYWLCHQIEWNPAYYGVIIRDLKVEIKIL